MKKFIFCGIFVALLTACSEQQTMESILDERLETVADGYISAAKAVEIANDFAAKFEENVESRSASPRHAASPGKVRLISSVNSRSAESRIYVVNYDDNQGFALVANHEVATPVLAFIPEGSYSDETAATIEGFQDFIEYANEYVYQAWNWGNDSLGYSLVGPTDPNIPIIRDTIPPVEFGFEYSYHFIHLNWEQGNLFGKYCPNGYAGCGPLAFAMVCAHFNKPEKITITFDGSNRELVLNWAKIKQHAQENYMRPNPLSPTNPDLDLWPDCKYTSCTKESHEQISLFLREVGHIFGASYLEDGTSIGLFPMYFHIATKFTDFNMTNFVDFNSFYVKNAVKNNKPVIMAGKTSSVSGHIWICDGYMSADNDNDGVEEDYFYYNWGYGGQFNGLFLSGVFHLKEGWSEYTNVQYSVLSSN